MIRLGITGTDTGVGKTLVAAALVAMLREQGVRVAAMKPVETGIEPGDPRSDGVLLRAAAGDVDALEEVGPLTFPEPLAPWVAARRAGRAVDVDLLDRAFRRLSAGREAVVVEGAGGLLAPLTRTTSFDALFRRWELDVVVVAANRLGCLNHTLLTVRAARAAGLAVRGVVLDSFAGSPGVAEETNCRALAELLTDVPVLDFPRVERPRDVGELASAGRRCALDRLLSSAR